MQITRDLQNKKLRVTFSDGESADIKVLLVSECDKHEDCRGLVYDVLSTNRPERLKKGAACWADLADIGRFEVIGD